jgi:putative ABC transport system ATP-binding protein
MKKAVIETRKLTKIYQMGDVRVVALDEVDLTINDGEFVAIMGPSGSGKSTLLNLLGCLDQPTSGEYFLNEEDVSQLDKTQLAVIRNKELGFVFQSYNLLAKTSAKENVALPLHYDRENDYTDEEIDQSAVEMLSTVGLGDRVDHVPQELSGGQQQRVAIARALINNPSLLLADEPTGNLDTKSGIEIMEILKDLHKSGRTIIMVTHEEEIAEYAQRVIRFRDGKIETDMQNGKSSKKEVIYETV